MSAETVSQLTARPGRVRSTATHWAGTSPRRITAGRIVGLLALLVMAAAWLVPFLWNILTSFKSEQDAVRVPVQILPEGGFTLEAYRKVLGQGNLVVWFSNSVLIAVAVTVLSVLISALAAYGFSRMWFKGRKLLLAITLASIMVPGQLLIVPLFRQMATFDLVDTYWGVILPQLVHPVIVYILKKFFDGIPRELEESARMDGAGPLRIFWSIVLPLSRPVLAAVSIFLFIGAWNNFLWPFIVTNNPDLMTLPVGLANVRSGYGLQYAQNSAAAVLAALPLLAVFVFFQRQIVRGVATTGLGGQ
ncbi:carbohydrate ABC transporter permease [Actinopolymorpha pittospori]